MIFDFYAGLYVFILTGMNTNCRENKNVHICNKQSVRNNIENEQIEEKGVQLMPNRAEVPLFKTRMLSPQAAVDIYNISNIEVTDTSLCVKTRTPSVFTICTWELHKDKYVSGDIHSTGQWEPAITRMIYDVLNQWGGVTFLDIGANMGYFSLLAASVGQPVVSVEPWDQHITKFAKSIHINKFEDRITVIKNAVSNNRRVVHIDVPRPDNQGAARLISENERNVPTTNSFYASSITLNDLTYFIKTKNIVMKIDIEGHECQALEMSDEIFDRFNVLFISMEWVILQTFKNQHGVACPTESIWKNDTYVNKAWFCSIFFYLQHKTGPKPTRNVDI